MNNLLISLRTIDKKRKRKMVATRKIRRIYAFLQADKSKDCIYVLSVRYGSGYKNQGIYKSKRETVKALKAFTEQ